MCADSPVVCQECGGYGAGCICEALDREGIVNGSTKRARARRRRELVTDGGEDVNADTDPGESPAADATPGVDGGVPDLETAKRQGMVIDVGEGDPERVRELLDDRPHRRGVWGNVSVLLPTAELERILLLVEESSHDTIADWIRGAVHVARRRVEIGRPKIQVDVPVSAEVWQRASLDAAIRYQKGEDPANAFHDVMIDDVPIAFNYVAEGSHPSYPPLGPDDLPIDRGAEVGRDFHRIGTDDPEEYREEVEESSGPEKSSTGGEDTDDELATDGGRPTLTGGRSATRVVVEVDVPRDVYEEQAERARQINQLDDDEWPFGPTTVEGGLIDMIDLDIRYYVDGERVDVGDPSEVEE